MPFKRTIYILFFFVFIFPVFSQDFTLDEWLSLYKEGFFGEVEDLQTDEDEFADEEDAIREDEIRINLEEDYIDEDKIIPSEEEIVITEEIFDEEDQFIFEGGSLVFEVPAFETRSFDDIFPGLTLRQRSSALSRNGLRYFLAKNGSPVLIPNPELGIDIIGSVMSRKPSHVIEGVLVVPYKEKEYDLLDIYNALGRIGNLKDYPIPFVSGDYYVFTESTRIISNRNRREIPDPAPAADLPFSETIYIRLKESTLGNLFLRADISISVYGVTYNLTNFTDIRYFLLPVMKAERFSTVIYLEPVKEGVLIYSVIGFYLPDFVADRVNLTPSINRRIQIIINWITDGLRRQEQ